jgi:hypothetical protein
MLGTTVCTKVIELGTTVKELGTTVKELGITVKELGITVKELWITLGVFLLSPINQSGRNVFSL